MSNLNFDNWSFFNLMDLFEFGDPKTYNINQISKLENEGLMTPYFTRTSKNNGIQGLYNIRPTNNGNTFSIGSVSNKLFYQEADFIKGPYTHNLVPLFKLDNELAIFIMVVFNFSISKRYTFSKGITRSHLEKETILLPADSTGKPDWQFMSDFIKNDVKDNLINLIKSEHELNLESLKGMIGNEFELSDNIYWEEFLIGEIFKVEKGIPLKKFDIIEGHRPFITTTTVNNGIANKISNDVKKWNNSITVTNNGECGTAFYHDYEFTANSDVSVLQNENLNVLTGLFICALIKLISPKYTWGKKLSKSKLEKEKIKLPVNSDKKIDWKWIEEFMSGGVKKATEEFYMKEKNDNLKEIEDFFRIKHQ